MLKSRLAQVGTGASVLIQGVYRARDYECSSSQNYPEL